MSQSAMYCLNRVKFLEHNRGGSKPGNYCLPLKITKPFIGSSSPVIIWKNLVLANSLLPLNIILSLSMLIKY